MADRTPDQWAEMAEMISAFGSMEATKRPEVLPIEGNTEQVYLKIAGKALNPATAQMETVTSLVKMPTKFADVVKVELAQHWALRQRVRYQLKQAGFHVDHETHPGSRTDVLQVKESEALAQLQAQARRHKVQPRELSSFVVHAAEDMVTQLSKGSLETVITFLFASMGETSVKEILDDLAEMPGANTPDHPATMPTTDDHDMMSMTGLSQYQCGTCGRSVVVRDGRAEHWSPSAEE